MESGQKAPPQDVSNELVFDDQSKALDLDGLRIRRADFQAAVKTLQAARGLFGSR